MDESTSTYWNMHRRWAQRRRKALGMTNKEIARESGLSYEVVSRAINANAKIDEDTLNYIDMYSLMHALKGPVAIIDKVLRIYVAQWFKTYDEIKSMFDPLYEKLAALELEDRIYSYIFIHLMFDEEIADYVFTNVLTVYVNKRIYKREDASNSRAEDWMLHSRWAQRRRENLGLTNEEIAKESGLPLETVSRAIDLDYRTPPDEDILDINQMLELMRTLKGPQEIIDKITPIIPAHFLKTHDKLKEMFEPIYNDLTSLEEENLSYTYIFILLNFSLDLYIDVLSDKRFPKKNRIED